MYYFICSCMIVKGIKVFTLIKVFLIKYLMLRTITKNFDRYKLNKSKLSILSDSYSSN